MNPREQGDFGERAAAVWLLRKGAAVAYPFPAHPDWDLVAEIDGELLRVQVKTSICFARGRWTVQLSTRGGNRSWTGTIKRLDASRCDYVFVLVGDGRQWFIPATSLGGGSGLLLGGPKYAAFEVEPGGPLPAERARNTALQSISRRRGDARAAKGIAL
jgi:PD-(D/E)XK nuclease superfamily protein